MLRNLRLKNHDKIIIGALNINSIRYKFDQLKNMIKLNLDILVIIETKIDESFPTNEFMIDGFHEPLRKDRTDNGGGILIYINEDIPMKELDLHKFPDNIEGIFIEINLGKRKWLLLGSYHPPTNKSGDEYYFKHVERALDVYSSKYDNFILLGDFNSEDTEPCLSNFLHQYDAKNLVKEKTCVKNVNNPSCVDLIITNQPNLFQNTTTLSTGLSDFHKMVVSMFKASFEKRAPKQITYRKYKNFNQDHFNSDLQYALEKHIISSYKDFENIFLAILEKHAPTKKKKIRANQAPYMTKALKKAMIKRSELETKYHKYKNSDALKAFKRQKNYVSRLYKKERKRFFKNLNLKDIKDDKAFWKTVKPFFSDKSNVSQNITIIEGKEIIKDEAKVAETLNKYFKDAVKTLGIEENRCLIDPVSPGGDLIEDSIEKFKHHPSILAIKNVIQPEVFSFAIPTIKDVEEQLHLLDPSKVVSHNNIPPKHLKSSSVICAPILHSLMVKLIEDKTFPDELKLANLTPVFKRKGAKTSVKNYRPISVLPTVSKLFERFMQEQITNHIEKYLSPYLCGYRKGFSTQSALLSLIERWKKSLDNHGYAGAMLMDLSKAFDTINHELLIAKLHAYGFSKDALYIIHSYLSNRWQRTKIANRFSSWAELLQGVPQGSVLGPLLFNIFINDLFFINERTNICSYADDTTLHVCDLDLEAVLLSLQHDAMIAIEWFESNYMKINADKCHLILSGFRHQMHSIDLGGFKIWESREEKLLGVKIDNELRFNSHVLTICKEANRKLSALGRISNLIPFEQRRVLFKAFIESRFEYCPLVWMFHDRNVHHKINHLHERALRIVYKDDKSLFTELLKKDGSVTIHEKTIQKIALEMFKCKSGINNLIMNDVFKDRKFLGPGIRSQVEFQCSKINTVSYGENSLRNLGPMIWNLVPTELKLLRTIKEFKSAIKAWTPAKCPCKLCKPYVQGLGYVSLVD